MKRRQFNALLPRRGRWAFPRLAVIPTRVPESSGACWPWWAAPPATLKPALHDLERVGLTRRLGRAVLRHRAAGLSLCYTVGKAAWGRFCCNCSVQGRTTLVGQLKSDFAETLDLVDKLETCLRGKACHSWARLAAPTARGRAYKLCFLLCFLMSTSPQMTGIRNRSLE